MEYVVNFQNVVSTQIEVEANSPEEAIELAMEDEDMPGSLTVGAFGSTDAVDDGDWQPTTVTNETGDVVWNEGDSLTVTVTSQS